MEMHPNPAKALSDGPQSLTPENFAALMQGLQRLSGFLQESGLAITDL